MKGDIKMSRNTAIVLGIIGGLVFLCICVGIIAYVALNQAGQAIEQAVTEDPAQVAQIAQGMVEYNLPSGYREQFGMSFFGFDVVAFGPDSTDQMIVLMQFPESAGLNQAEMEQQMKQSLQQQTGQQNIQMQVVEQIEATIRDQRVPLTISEGTNSAGTVIRQLSGVFQGKNGIVLLMIMGEKQRWDQGAVNAFIASLR
jgi:hypothetical protein